MPSRAGRREGRESRHGAEMGRPEGKAVHGLQDEGQGEPRIKGHDREADRGRGGSGEDQPDARAAPDSLPKKHEDEDLGDHARRPEISDGGVREAERLPVDAGKGVEGAVGALSERRRDHHQPEDLRQSRGGRPPPAFIGPHDGFRRFLRHGRQGCGDSQKGNECEGHDDRIGPEPADHVAGRDVGQEEGHGAHAADPAVVQARVALHRVRHHEVVSGNDRRLREGDQGHDPHDGKAAVHEQEQREADHLAQVAEQEQAPGPEGPVRQGQQRRRCENADDDRDGDHDADDRGRERLALQPQGKERQVDPVADEARGLQGAEADAGDSVGWSHGRSTGRAGAGKNTVKIPLRKGRRG